MKRFWARFNQIESLCLNFGNNSLQTNNSEYSECAVRWLFHNVNIHMHTDRYWERTPCVHAIRPKYIKYTSGSRKSTMSKFDSLILAAYELFAYLIRDVLTKFVVFFIRVCVSYVNFWKYMMSYNGIKHLNIFANI